MYIYIYTHVHKGNADYNIQFPYAGTYNETRSRFPTYSKIDSGCNMHLNSRLYGLEIQACNRKLKFWKQFAVIKRQGL
jgi:hypothetical protein